MNPNVTIQQEKRDIEILRELLKGRPPEFQQKVLDTIRGMALMLDYYKKTG